MENTDNSYSISFFKPANDHAKANRNMVVWLVSIWFVAIFGFHIVLKLIEKPTHEAAYTTFESVWENVKNNQASSTEYQQLGQTTLSVLGKIAISPEEKIILDNALSSAVYQLTADSLRPMLVDKISTFEQIKDTLTDIGNVDYVNAKNALSAKLTPVLGLSELDVRTQLIALELSSDNISQLTDETAEALPKVMSKYLIHNQSILTDFKFLGFPFHYFYSAVFLLVLFVGLCWIYCVKTDTLNAKFNIID